MNAHKNARTTPFGRAVMVRRVLEEGWSVAAVASAFEVSTRTVRKWLARFGSEGDAGLQNRSSAPHLVANQLPAPWLAMIARLRREYRMTGEEIAGRLHLPRAPWPGISPASGWAGWRARAERAGAALPTRTRRRARPPRRQEARPLRARSATASPAIGAAQQPRCWLGVRPRRHRRRLAACLRRGPADDERKASAIALPRPGACLVPRVRHVGSHAS